MPDLKQRFSLADELDAPDLWAESARRAAAPSAPPRASREWPPGTGRRIAVGALAFAVFVAAIAFAWDLASPERRPAPRPPAAVDLAAELPAGWSELPAPPEVRSGAATAWTGSELLVWGGYEYVGGNEDPDAGGYVFDGRQRTWGKLPTSPLAGRSDPAFAWTGTELLIWGGWDGGFREPPYFDDGAAYDPIARTWRRLSPAPLSARSPFAVWTGEELIVWGSTDRFDRMRDGAAYDPSADTWRPIADAPTDVTDGSAVWTGEEMIVFGAALDGNNHADTPTAIGIAYDPMADTWRELPPSELSPQAMTASWLGDDLIAWDYDHVTAAYDPGSDGWRRLPKVPLSFAECRPASVATPMFVFGNYCGLTVVFSIEEGAWNREAIDRLEGEGCCRVLEPIAAGNVVLVPSHSYGMGLGTPDRRMFAYSLRKGGNDALGDVLEPAPFIPRSEVVTGEVRMPVLFPDGSRATVVFPPELGLDEVSVQPDVSYVRSDNPAPRYPIVFLHDRNASIGDYVGGGDPVSVVTSHAIELWPMSERWRDLRRLPAGLWLRYRLSSWVALVAVPDIGSIDEVIASIHLEETMGFPIVRTEGGLALAEGFGESEGAVLTFGDTAAAPDVVSQLESTIFLGISRCAGFETEVGPDYGAACLGDGNVFASIYGARGGGFVARVIEGLRIEHFRAA